MSRRPDVRRRAAAVALVVLAGTAGCATIAGIDQYETASCPPDCSDVADGDGTQADTADAADSGSPDVEPDARGDAIADAPRDSTIDAAESDVDAASAPDASDALDAGDAADAADASASCSPTPSKLVSITGTVGSFSIDATEVTNAQYASFLASVGAPSGQPAHCAWNTTYYPSTVWPAPASKCDNPVVWIDWCDAYAYCKWAGKRLCGSPAGGPVSWSGSTYQTVAGSEWFAACSPTGAAVWPYGATADTPAMPICVDNAFDGVANTQATDVTRAVGSAALCHGQVAPFTQLFDLAGNVREWEDDCQASVGSMDNCRARGGAFDDNPTKTSCDQIVQLTRGSAASNLGFRCCAP